MLCTAQVSHALPLTTLAAVIITVDTYGHLRQGTSIALADRLDTQGGNTRRYATSTQLPSQRVS